MLSGKKLICLVVAVIYISLMPQPTWAASNERQQAAEGGTENIIG